MFIHFMDVLFVLQIALMRDIRRRGKNKVAAQNCRKRKLDVLVNLEDEMTDMEKMRDKLAEERRLIDQQTRQAKEKYAALYDHIFRSLRDEHGRPYNPAEFSLQESSDGNVFLVRKATGNATSSVVSSSSSAAQQQFQGPPSSSSSSSSGSRSKDYSKQHKDFPSQKKKSREWSAYKMTRRREGDWLGSNNGTVLYPDIRSVPNFVKRSLLQRMLLCVSC